MQNKGYKLAKRPQGLVKQDDFSFFEEDFSPELQDGEVLLQNIFISLDPAMRGWMNQSRSYVPPVRVGQVMRAGTIAKVVESKSQKFKVGDYASALGGVQLFTKAKDSDLQLLDPAGMPLVKQMSCLGMTAMTAWFGLLDVGKLKAGDKVVVSAASGAVGSLVVQIAKNKGCEVIGIAGGPKKCDFVKSEYGADHVIDYKEGDVAMKIKRIFKGGLDVYFDNVGGELLEAALFNLNKGARIVICGAISQYNATEVGTGPRNYLSLLVNRASMAGFVVFDYADRYHEAESQMRLWLKEGKWSCREQVETGIENFYPTFMKLFHAAEKSESSSNFGKLILKVSDE